MRYQKKRFGLMALLYFILAAVTFGQATKPAKFLYPQMIGPAQTPAPRTFDALHYIIRTRFDRVTKTVFGDETVLLKPLADGFKEIRLDAKQLEIEAIRLDASNTKLSWRLKKPDKLIIKLDRAYAARETIAVRLQYRVVNPRKGINFTPEGTLPGARIRRPPQIWTQGEPEDSRYWFAARDYPDDLATSEQYITTTAPDEIAIGNGKLLETIAHNDGTKIFHWKMEQPHAVYLVSLVVGEFVKLEERATLPPFEADGVTVSVPLEYYTYAGAEDAARAAYAHTPAMMRLFVGKLGLTYPFPRYGQTGVAYFSQYEGMENITSTTLADASVLRSELFREPRLLSDHARRDVDNLLAHELAHSWFGNLVTCRDWPSLWLNEGFATFMEAVWQEHLTGSAGYRGEMLTNQSLYLLEDKLVYRRALAHNRYRDPQVLFDATTYKKGSFVVNMLRRLVGDEVFWQSLNLYLTRHAHQTVTVADVQRAFEEKSGQRLDWFFRQWVYQAGYPEIRVRYRYDAAKKLLSLIVQQTQKPDATTPSVFRLPGVQIEMTTADGVRTETLNITARSQVFTFELAQAPKRLLFDADERVLKVLDYPQQPDASQVSTLSGSDGP